MNDGAGHMDMPVWPSGMLYMNSHGWAVLSIEMRISNPQFIVPLVILIYPISINGQ